MTWSVQLSRSESTSYQAAERTIPTRHVLQRVIHRSFEQDSDSQDGSSRRSFEQDSCMRRPSENSPATMLEQDQEVEDRRARCILCSKSGSHNRHANGGHREREKRQLDPGTSKRI
jgi:hypothetical protein